MSFLVFILTFIAVYTAIGLTVAYFWVRLFGEPRGEEAPIGVIFIAWPFTLCYYLVGVVKKKALEHNEKARQKKQ